MAKGLPNDDPEDTRDKTKTIKKEDKPNSDTESELQSVSMQSD
jgi:hypothetical protein